MSFFRRNINGILGTILFHLVVIFVCLACKVAENQQDNQESYVLIDPSEFDGEDEQTTAEDVGKDVDEQIEQFFENLPNAGASYSGTTSSTVPNSSGSTMSQADLQAKYEDQFLREKYGDNYDDVQNRTYEDYIDPSRMETYQSDNKSRNVVTSGPALVYADPDNKQREASYLHVPVYTCEGSGVVVVRISIASSGKVTSAEVVSKDLTSDEECLSNAARNSALKSLFSRISGGKAEGGKITYKFVRQ